MTEFKPKLLCAPFLDLGEHPSDFTLLTISRYARPLGITVGLDDETRDRCARLLKEWDAYVEERYG